jgi:hypothetical protein
MINLIIEIDGEEHNFNVPTGWDEVTVKTAASLSAIKRTDRTEVDIMVEIISLLANIDTDLIYMLTSEQFAQVIEIVKFTTEEINGDLADSVMVDGEEYFLKKDFSQLTMGEIISIDTILGQSQNNIAPSMAKLLCIFLRKKKENGNIESFKNSFMERESLFEQVIISDVHNLFLFFLDGKNSSQNNMKDYSESQNQKPSEIDSQN